MKFIEKILKEDDEVIDFTNSDTSDNNSLSQLQIQVFTKGKNLKEFYDSFSKYTNLYLRYKRFEIYISRGTLKQLNPSIIKATKRKDGTILILDMN